MPLPHIPSRVWYKSRVKVLSWLQTNLNHDMILTLKKNLLTFALLIMILASVAISCKPGSTETDEEAATEQPADSTAAEHPDEEHPTKSEEGDHPADSTDAN